MNTKILIISAILLLCGLSSSNAACGPDLESTMLIVQTLCQPGNHEDDVAKLFYACYDDVPARFLFTKCQIAIFGSPLDSKENIARTCANGGELPNYIQCLTDEFEANQIDPLPLITQVNRCQGELLGTC